MLNKFLIQPRSIAVVGASNKVDKPGGGLVRNLLEGGFKGGLYPVNPNGEFIQGLKVYNSLEQLPDTDLAILAISASQCIETVEYLAEKKATKAFIIISAGFSETGEDGRRLEEKLFELSVKHNIAILGPNCIGLINSFYKGFFVTPLPKTDKRGVDFVSASGSLALFVFEIAAAHGLLFDEIITVGNSVSIGVEEVLAHWDENFKAGESSRIKLVYVEQIRKPELLYRHINSLRHKGCKVIVVKPGDSDAGARAALSHTGALAGDSKAYNLLIEKAGAIKCISREELVYASCVLTQKPLKGKRLAIITHAGGPAVMLCDILNNAGIKIPEIKKQHQEEILTQLNPGASAVNPVDMLATANREQLKWVINYFDRLEYIDGIIVIYGNTGMEDLDKTYTLLDKVIKDCKKPVYPVLPGLTSTLPLINNFIDKGNVAFFDEVMLGQGLIQVLNEPILHSSGLFIPESSSEIDSKVMIPLNDAEVKKRLEKFGIPVVKSEFFDKSDTDYSMNGAEYPLVVKAVGVLHKTDVGAVCLNIKDADELKTAIDNMHRIEGATGVQIQEMLSGIELYMGAKLHPGIGYSIHLGVGGIFVELFQDISSTLAPVGLSEARELIRKIKSQKLFSGFRNMPIVDIEELSGLIVNFSGMLCNYTDICEVDLNPLIATDLGILTVDARIIVHQNIKK